MRVNLRQADQYCANHPHIKNLHIRTSICYFRESNAYPAKPMQSLNDYSYFYQSSEKYEIAGLRVLEDAQKVITAAYQQNKPVRIRGNGHSMNGSSLPKDDELLLLSTDCDHFRFEKAGTITVGSGVAIWDVNSFLKQYGYGLLVYNDGSAAASTVGGYLSAGGIGESSYRYGGFWETVEEVIFINGKGEIIRSIYGDGIFEWLFGSMGQLGYVYEVCLRIRSIESPMIYPHGISGKISAGKNEWNRLAWYNLFTTQQHAAEAIQELNTLCRIHKRAWANLPLYRYNLNFKKFNPPLIHPAQESLVALGIWGEPWNGANFDIETLRLLEADFAELVREKPYFRRYVQAEFTFENFDYAMYFGPEVMAGFKRVKQQLDPRGIFGKGMIK